MEIDQLKAFLTLARTKNFSKAAETLHLVQSSVSTRIRSLENTLGRPLFLRDNRHVELTAAGISLIPYAERILTLVEEGKEEIGSRTAFEDKISIGATDSLWRHLIKPVLLDFATLYPKYGLFTKTSHSWEVVQFLLDDVIQIGFVYHPPRLPGVKVLTFYDDEVLLVASRSLPLPKEVIGKDELRRLPFVSLEWDGPLQEWTKKSMPVGYYPRIQLDQLSMQMDFVLEGKGVAFMPRCTVSEALKKGEIVSLPLARSIQPPRRKSFVISRVEKRKRPPIEAWFALMHKHGFRLIPYHHK